MPAGRPTKMTPETVKKLEEAFAIGASDGEACFYADISKETLYTYQDKHPQFVDRKRALKERPVLLARQTVLKAMESDPMTAKWYLERKMNKEFATRQKSEHSGEQKLIVETRRHSAIGAPAHKDEDGSDQDEDD